MSLRNKVVFITDADTATGKTIVKRLADEGAHFVLNSPSGGNALEAEQSYCQSVGSGVMLVNIDLCRSAEVGAILEEAAERIGAVDVLIHNNNLVKPTSVETCDESLFLQVMNYNAKSAFICTQAVGKQMAARRSGKVIYISSIHAEKPTGSSFVYSVSRSSLKMLAREAALELGRYHVNVNTIEVGPVDGDDETFRSDFSTLYHDYQYKVPGTVLGTQDDIADCVLYLSTDASRYVNGTDIRLDGGFVLHYMDHKMNKNPHN
ncbi:SDR family NAD(P)-dependent oxidoreductase [Paenibacillus piri]|uniref:SDR family oxidoreductase n=1 Tax=Paenibacillus piri TaxID=2547395 RepID=A0A4R5KFR8_9BACL|nr:SDR family oxidoreductase [Paenibacillus piri]TDF94163.1 SDR family oxidoreductase [Paenibacillus piri]